MADLIDRQAFMKAMYHKAFETDGDTMWQSGCWVRYRAVEQVVKGQPSVDAVKVVRCKDCKHWIPYDWMFSEVWKSQNIDDYAESEIGCTYCDMSMGAMDYCSRGEWKDDQ